MGILRTAAVIGTGYLLYKKLSHQYSAASTSDDSFTAEPDAATTDVQTPVSTVDDGATPQAVPTAQH